MHVPSGYGKQTLDFEGACCGRAFAIEAKRAGKDITSRQLTTVEDMERGGVQVFAIDGPEGCALLDGWLSAISRRRA